MKVILFDFDGVIVDTFSFCFRIMSSRMPLTEDEYRARFEGNINEALKPALEPTDGKPRPDFFSQYTPELMACCPDKRITDAIQDLAHDHILIIVSSTISQPISSYLEQCGLRDCFKEILGNDVEKSKVKKIQSVLERYRIQPTETVFITDTLGDIKEASACGVPCIAVTWGYHPRETLEKGSPRAILDDPGELVRTVQELVS